MTDAGVLPQTGTQAPPEVPVVSNTALLIFIPVALLVALIVGCCVSYFHQRKQDDFFLRFMTREGTFNTGTTIPSQRPVFQYESGTHLDGPRFLKPPGTEGANGSQGSSLDQHLNNQVPSDSLVERSYTAPPLEQRANSLRPSSHLSDDTQRNNNRTSIPPLAELLFQAITKLAETHQQQQIPASFSEDNIPQVNTVSTGRRTTRLSNLGELQTIDEPLNRPEMQAYLAHMKPSPYDSLEPLTTEQMRHSDLSGPSKPYFHALRSYVETQRRSRNTDSIIRQSRRPTTDESVGEETEARPTLNRLSRAEKIQRFY